MNTLVNYEPIHEFRTLDELFSRMFGPGPRSSVSSAALVPFDILERPDSVVIRASYPGVAPEDLEVNIENHVLTIKGQVRFEEESEQTKVYLREITSGQFSRSIRLPEKLNEDAVEARFKNGVVTITIPKVIEEKLQPRKIEIRTN